jgi:hypothetical protein
MGFSLWIAGEVAFAQGTYESRPAGTAVIAVTDLFKRRDFRPGNHAPSVLEASYVGLFASLGDLNAELTRRRSVHRRGTGSTVHDR